MGNPRGFNPIPTVSLGDSERVLEVYSESIGTKTSTVDMDDIINRFIINTDHISNSGSQLGTSVQQNCCPVNSTINLSRIDDRLTAKATADLAKVREDITKQREIARELEKSNQEYIANSRKLAEEQEKARAEAEAERQRLFEIEQQRAAEAERQLQIERAKAQQELEKQRLEAERIKQEAELEKARALAEAEKVRAEIERQRAEADKLRREAELQRARLEAERVKAEADRLRHEEELRIAQERVRNEQEAEQRAKAQKQAELKAKREQLEQLKKLREAQENAAKQKANSKAAAAKKVAADEVAKIAAERSATSKYDGLDAQTLFKEVKAFAESKGLSRKIIDRKLLDDTFGKVNINKLIVKSYLISIGKGVTFGNG